MYFDTEQEREGIVDVTTHMIDLIQWIGFLGINLDLMGCCLNRKAIHKTASMPAPKEMKAGIGKE